MSTSFALFCFDLVIGPLSDDVLDFLAPFFDGAIFDGFCFTIYRSQTLPPQVQTHVFHESLRDDSVDVAFLILK